MITVPHRTILKRKKGGAVHLATCLVLASGLVTASREGRPMPRVDSVFSSPRGSPGAVVTDATPCLTSERLLASDDDPEKTRVKLPWTA